MRFAVVDDEYPARNELSYLILQCIPDAEIHQADSGEKALELVGKNNYDAVFLDIHLGDMSGTLLSYALRKVRPDLKVVFATAYDSYAVKAFDLEAVDYIMKPFDPQRVEQCLKRIRERDVYPETPAGKLTINLDKRVVVLNIFDIAYIESQGHRSEIYTRQGKYSTGYPLAHFEERLKGDSFFRVHKSYLVNTNYISEIIPWVNGAFSLKLKGFEETSLPVSRNQVRRLKQIFGI